ncbi:MAG: hypothetical protein HYT12_01125 [Candidatus Liptonbacteria bacterium]|nr:hypothetical protein [Candidatus Liptonbacteria bacterium]
MEENKTIAWEAPEFDYVEKEPFWYLVGAVAVMALFAVALYQKNFLFGLFIIIAAFLVFVWSRQKPRTISFLLNTNGIKVGSYKFYMYGELEDFSILENINLDGFHELILRQEDRINPYIKIKMPESKTKEIREFLANYLPEAEHDEGLPEALSRIIKF